jgi:hypothetical protein
VLSVPAEDNRLPPRDALLLVTVVSLAAWIAIIAAIAAKG